MGKQFTPEEKAQQILTSPIVDKASAESPNKFKVEIEIQETKQSIFIAVGREGYEIVYQPLHEITPEFVHSELERHRRFLDLAKKFLSKQYTDTVRVVNLETNIEEAMKWTSPENVRIWCTITKISMRIVNALSKFEFAPPKEVFEKLTSQKMALIVFLQRMMSEIQKQKQAYEKLKESFFNEDLEELIHIMGEIIYTLKNAENTMQNACRAQRIIVAQILS